MATRWRGRAVLFMVGFLGGFVAEAYAQNSAFTYQGRIRQMGSLVTQPVDLQFDLWTAAAGGMHVAGPLFFTNVLPANGLFSQPLDFVPTAFADGGNR